jgi:hypothetical protein
MEQMAQQGKLVLQAQSVLLVFREILDLKAIRVRQAQQAQEQQVLQARSVLQAHKEIPAVLQVRGVLLVLLEQALQALQVQMVLLGKAFSIKDLGRLVLIFLMMWLHILMETLTYLPEQLAEKFPEFQINGICLHLKDLQALKDLLV